MREKKQDGTDEATTGAGQSVMKRAVLAMAVIEALGIMLFLLYRNFR